MLEPYPLLYVDRYPLLYVDRSVEDKPKVVFDHTLVMDDPLQIRVLIDELINVLAEHTTDGRWIQHD